MKAAFAYKGGPYAVEEALETLKALGRRIRDAARRAREAAQDGHRQMVAEWIARLESGAAV
jgi:hypothetical protein